MSFGVSDIGVDTGFADAIFVLSNRSAMYFLTQMEATSVTLELNPKKILAFTKVFKRESCFQYLDQVVNSSVTTPSDDHIVNIYQDVENNVGSAFDEQRLVCNRVNKPKS